MAAASSHHLLRNQIADIPISQLAAKVNTPFYVYDEQKIIERINDLKAFFCIGDFDRPLWYYFQNVGGGKRNFASAISTDHKRIRSGPIYVY